MANLQGRSRLSRGRGLQEAEMDSVELKYLVSLRGENMTARRLIAEGKQISCQKI